MISERRLNVGWKLLWWSSCVVVVTVVFSGDLVSVGKKKNGHKDLWFVSTSRRFSTKFQKWIRRGRCRTVIRLFSRHSTYVHDGEGAMPKGKWFVVQTLCRSSREQKWNCDTKLLHGAKRTSVAKISMAVHTVGNFDHRWFESNHRWSVRTAFWDIPIRGGGTVLKSHTHKKGTKKRCFTCYFMR
jgi:hypothetical protein